MHRDSPAVTVAADLGAAVGVDGEAVGERLERPDEAEAVRWARSGAMFLTGTAGGPPELAPGRPATTMAALAAVVDLTSERVGRRVALDGPMLLGERGAIARFSRRGSTTVGGTGHMLEVADGHVALNLARPEDVDLLPAWLGTALDPSDWTACVARPVGSIG